MATKTERKSLKAERDQHEKDLEELRESNHKRGLAYHRPAEVHQDVVVSVEDDDGEPTVEKVGELHAFGGVVYLNVEGRFSKDDLFVLEQQLEKAFQAVT